MEKEKEQLKQMSLYNFLSLSSERLTIWSLGQPIGLIYGMKDIHGKNFKSYHNDIEGYDSDYLYIQFKGREFKNEREKFWTRWFGDNAKIYYGHFDARCGNAKIVMFHKDHFIL